jgi:periplasmic divalent cation tolerance protein
MATDYDLCFVTVGDKKTAEEIASGLLEGRLAACVSAVPGLTSTYWWKDRIEKSSETLLIIKTRRTLRNDIIQFVKERHPYAVPETVFTEIAGASKDYLDWIGANTLFTTNIPLDKAPENKKEL